MALRKYQLSIAILIAISLGISSGSTWSPNVRRYESYDLERGPVFYEAYYPDNNEEARNYQEKRFFDRDAIFERSYQLAPNRLDYPENVLQGYQNREDFQYPDPRSPVESVKGDPRTYSFEGNFNRNNLIGFRKEEPNFEDDNRQEPLDIKGISNLARRAISRDLENWSALESYLDQGKYQDQSPAYRRHIAVESTDRDARREPYERAQNQIPPGRNSNLIRKLTVRDLAARARSFDPVRYRQQQQDRPLQQQINSYPPENIFEPRPQVINYVFSKKTVKSVGGKKPADKEAKGTSGEAVPRNYGDNLIQEEIKTEGGKDVKVTSIEVSELPRHKTRHRHGELPKRDWSHRT